MSHNILEERIHQLSKTSPERFVEGYIQVIKLFKTNISNHTVYGFSDNEDGFIEVYNAYGEKYLFAYNIPLGGDVFTQLERINSKFSSEVIISIPENRDPIAPFLISACHLDL